MDRALRWMSILSLDAPLVAAAWLLAVGRPTPVELAALSLAVWWGYAVDRWLDGWKRGVVQQGAARHRFAAQHRRGWGAFLGLVALVAFALIPAQLPTRLVTAGLGLALALAVYIALDQLWPRALRAFAQRELWVAAAVAVAVVLFAGWGVAGRADLTRSAPVAVALFALCAADCRAIRLLEGASPSKRGLAGPSGALFLCALAAMAFAWSGALPQAVGALVFGAFLALAFEAGSSLARCSERMETVAPRCDLALASAGFCAALCSALLERLPLLAG